ncbi:MAG: hypothetical protein IKJ03_00635 [Mycoplasmataceae bacterium]|nr:hypothetical protein [Mycoplasmataceae bacterium]
MEKEVIDVKLLAQTIDYDPSLVSTKEGYFDMEKWLNILHCNPLSNPDMGMKMVIFSCERNNGKTYAGWNYDNKFWSSKDFKWRIAFAKPLEEDRKAYQMAFKTAYEGIFETKGNKIMKYTYDNDGRIVSSMECGAFVSINLQEKYKSTPSNSLRKNNDDEKGGFINYHMLFWDEFNEKKQTSLGFFKDFTNLLSTVGRRNDPFLTLLIGNKVNANSDIYTKFCLNTNRKDLTKTYIQKIYTPKTNEFIGYYIDIGSQVYNKLGNKETLANKVAQFDKGANRMFNEGGFLEGQIYNVLNYTLFTNKKVINNIRLGEFLYEYGTFINEEYTGNTPKYYVEQVDDPVANVIALDTIGFMRGGINLNREDGVEVANMFIKQSKMKMIFYDSFDTMLLLEQWMSRLGDLSKI